MKLIKNLIEKMFSYFDTGAKLHAANRRNKELVMQNEFLIKTINDTETGITPTTETKAQITAFSAEKRAKKQSERIEELEALQSELEFMEAIPVSGRNNMLQRDRAVDSHRIRILELETEIFSESSL